jgi:hypothetical protein
MNEQYVKIIDDIKKEFPNFEVIEKNKSFLMKIIYIVTLMPLWNPHFMDLYVTVMFGKVYMPPNLIGTSTGYQILRHERIHLQDAKSWPVLFELSYLLFPLPLIVTMRAYWEYRAYCESLIVQYEIYGYVHSATLDFIISQFTSSYYLWMFPFPKYLNKKFMQFLQERNIPVR